mgnify:CR=1 FL=1
MSLWRRSLQGLSPLEARIDLQMLQDGWRTSPSSLLGQFLALVALLWIVRDWPLPSWQWLWPSLMLLTLWTAVVRAVRHFRRFGITQSGYSHWRLALLGWHALQSLGWGMLAMALLDVASVDVQEDGALDPEHPQAWLDLGQAKVVTTLDAAAFATLQREGQILIAGCVNGAAEGALNATADYMSTRVQFGRPLSAKQAVRHLLARMRLLQDTTQAGIERLLRTDVERQHLGEFLGIDVDHRRQGTEHRCVEHQDVQLAPALEN